MDGGYAELAEHVDQQLAYQKVLFKHKYAQLFQVIGKAWHASPYCNIGVGRQFHFDSAM